MIRTNNDCLQRETVQKYAYAIRHFRGYLDKEKFDDDLAFLMDFVRDVSGTKDRCDQDSRSCESCRG